MQITYTDYGTVEEIAATQVREAVGSGPGGEKKTLKAEDAKKRKEKLEKKKMRLKEIEEQREGEKKRWQVWPVGSARIRETARTLTYIRTCARTHMRTRTQYTRMHTRTRTRIHMLHTHAVCVPSHK